MKMHNYSEHFKLFAEQKIYSGASNIAMFCRNLKEVEGKLFQREKDITHDMISCIWGQLSTL
jgi:hypothetical protein